MSTNETMAKRTIGFHARKYNPLSSANVVIAKRDNMYDTHRDIYTLDHLIQEHSSNEDVTENVVTNETEEMESVQQDESLTTDNITIIKQLLEQTNTSSLKSNKHKLTERSISSCNKTSKANLFATEEDKDYTIMKYYDSSSTVLIEHDSDLKTGDSYNVQKAHNQSTLKLHSDLITLRNHPYSTQQTENIKNNQLTI